MSIVRIIKQDIINSLKLNLNEDNVIELLEEFKTKSCMEMDISILQTNYKW